MVDRIEYLEVEATESQTPERIDYDEVALLNLLQGC